MHLADAFIPPQKNTFSKIDTETSKNICDAKKQLSFYVSLYFHFVLSVFSHWGKCKNIYCCDLIFYLFLFTII